MLATKELFSRDSAYLGTDGGLPRGGRQRAVWSNDRKMMQTPLGARTGSKPGGQSSDGPGSNGPGDCRLCNGSGHRDAQCPNHVAKKDRAWSGKTENARARNCQNCEGIGHWAHHHKTAQNTQRRVTEPTEEAAPEPVSQQAQSQIKVCGNWKKFGVCTAPKDKRCDATHPKAEKDLLRQARKP